MWVLPSLKRELLLRPKTQAVTNPNAADDTAIPPIKNLFSLKNDIALDVVQIYLIYSASVLRNPELHNHSLGMAPCDILFKFTFVFRIDLHGEQFQGFPPPPPPPPPQSIFDGKKVLSLGNPVPVWMDTQLYRSPRLLTLTRSVA